MKQYLTPIIALSYTCCAPTSQGVTFKEHTAAVWCVAADRETLVTGDADGNVFARDFGPLLLPLDSARGF